MKKKSKKISKKAEKKKNNEIEESEKNFPQQLKFNTPEPALNPVSLVESVAPEPPIEKDIFICPLCNQEVDENVKDYHRNLEEWAINEILDANPDWRLSPTGLEKAEEFYRRVVLQRKIQGEA